MKEWLSKRKIVQYISALLLNSSMGFEMKWLCSPVLNCHSCALAYFACPIGVLSQFSGNHIFPFLLLGMILLAGALVGRILCGWVCPFGLVQDILFKIPSKKIIMPQWTSYIKYLVLLIMVILIPFFLGPETYYSFCRICPAAALQVTLPASIKADFQGITVMNMVKFAFLAFFLIGVIVSSRSFCKVFCPIGAILAPLNLISLWKIKMPEDGCTMCGKCHKVCIVDDTPSVRVLNGKAPNQTLDCVVCHECQNACPMKKKEDNGNI